MSALFRRKAGCFLAGLGLVLGATVAGAQTTTTWITAEGGDWGVATNWSPAVVPNSGTNIADFSTLALPSDMVVSQSVNRATGGFIFGDTDGTPNAISLNNGADNFRIFSGPAGSEIPIHVANGQATIYPRINFSTASGTRKTGAGTLSLAYGGNTYGTNGIILEAGITSYASNFIGTFSAGPIVFEGGALLWPFGASGLTPAQAMTVNPAGGILILTNGTQSYRLNSADLLRGTGKLAVRGGGVFFLAGVQSNFAGTLSIQEQTTMIVGLGANYPMAASTIEVSEGSTFRFQKGTVLQISRLTGTGQVAEAGSGGTSGLIVGDDGASPFSFVFSGTNNVQLNLTKTGTSTMVWAGTNAHFGTTTIAQGTMIANGQHVGSVGVYTVGVAGVLGGTGTIRRAVTVNGIIAPGDGGIGTLTVSNTTWNAGTNWVFQLGAASAADRLASLGTFVKGTGAGFAFDIQNTGVAGVYTLVTWAASTTFVSGDFSAVNVPAGLSPSFAVNATNLTLTLTTAALGPQLGVTPVARDFGALEVGLTLELGFVVTNSGDALLTGTAAITGAAPFTVTEGASFALGPGETTNVMIEFAPLLPESFADGVLFSSDGGSFTGAVSGLGILLAGSTNASISISGGLVGFQFGLASGALYRVQATTNLLSDVAWTDVTGALTNRVGATVSFVDGSSTGFPSRAYRVLSP